MDSIGQERTQADMPQTSPVQVIGERQVHEAEAILQKYKQGKAALEARIIENEKWYQQRQWEIIGRSKNPGDPEPASAWLLNSLANKHADAMDNYPTLAVLPREQSDKQDADILSSVLPTVFEQAEYEQTYSDMWWYKLKNGTGVTGVFWDSSLLNGLGDISVRSLDLLNLFWEPGVNDIQDSKHVFFVALADRESMQEQFPELAEEGASTPGLLIAEYAHDDTIDTAEKVLVVDWYYKRQIGNRTMLHYCKFCSGKVLYASENDEQYSQSGFYDHGKYPFVFDTLFPVQNAPTGFGYVDMMKSAQMYIDKLDQALLKNTVMGAKPRFWLKNDGSVNVKEYADLSNDFVSYTGSGNPAESIPPIAVPPINPYALTMRTHKIEELKETSGNRDFSQGSTTSGVTAASAIAALQEAGSKLSRDMIKGAYRAFSQVGYLCIELMRQFYTVPRMFRITGKSGEMEFAEFGGMQIAPKSTSDGFMQGTRMPYFDIRVVPQRENPFSTVAQNERAKELYGMGFFRPDMADQSLLALDMMQFEGIDRLKARISENGTLFTKMQQLGGLTLMMAQQLDALQGTQYMPQVQAILGQNAGMPVGNAQHNEVQTNALGDALNTARSSTSGEARKQAAKKATPQ